MAIETANSMFRFDLILNDKLLIQHVRDMTEYLEIENGWTPTLSRETYLHPGSWGVDVNCCRIGVAYELCDVNYDIDSITTALRLGWQMCHDYWSKTKPNNVMMIDPGYRYSNGSVVECHHLTACDTLDNLTKQIATYVKNNCLYDHN